LRKEKIRRGGLAILRGRLQSRKGAKNWRLFLCACLPQAGTWYNSFAFFLNILNLIKPKLYEGRIFKKNSE
jgi:hypothetical protein